MKIWNILEKHDIRRKSIKFFMKKFPIKSKKLFFCIRNLPTNNKI